jgi:hypothetical protein
MSIPKMACVAGLLVVVLSAVAVLWEWSPAAAEEKASQAAGATPDVEGMAKIKALQEERIKTLRQRKEILEEMNRARGYDLAEVLRASNDLLKAELDAAESPTRRIAILGEIVKNMTLLEKIAEARQKAGTPGGEPAVYLEAKANRLKAEIALERERMKAKTQPAK